MHTSTTLKTISRLLLGAAFLLPLAAPAQDSKTAYFVDNYTYRYRMNPAFGNDRNFVAIPAIGDLNVGLNGNLSLTDVIYNVNGRTTTFLNPGISAAEVMGNLSDVNKVNANVGVTVLAFGFKAFGGYNTISVNARANVGAHVPRSLFQLMKEGAENQSYDISDVRARAEGYGEVALGHSRDISALPGLRVGATLKVLLGAGYADARFNRATLDLDADGWNILSNAELRMNLKGIDYEMKHNDNADRDYVGGLDGSYKPVNGLGFALDLGGVYAMPMVKGLTLSAAVLDLGFISYKNTKLATTNGDRLVTTDRYTFNAESDAPNSFSNEWKKLRNDLTALYQMDNAGDIGSQTHMLGATLNVGADYQMPFYNPLTVGLLSSTRFAGKYTSTEARLSANIAPCRVFSAGISGSVGTFGASFGWLLNLHCPGYNFFLGMDNTFAKIAKQGVPLASNASVNFGMNVLF